MGRREALRIIRTQDEKEEEEEEEEEDKVMIEMKIDEIKIGRPRGETAGLCRRMLVHSTQYIGTR